MPITLLDIVLIVVMLISGLLAMVRGFMREVLSITAWLLAAAATLYSYSKLLPLAKQYFNNDIVAAVAVVGGVFLVTLLVKSRVVLAGTGQWLMSMLPDDPESTILKKLKRPRPEDVDTPDTAPGQRGELGNPADNLADAGYDRGGRIGMWHLVEAKGMAR
jgi:hypothetical protein